MTLYLFDHDRCTLTMHVLPINLSASRYSRVKILQSESALSILIPNPRDKYLFLNLAPGTLYPPSLYVLQRCNTAYKSNLGSLAFVSRPFNRHLYTTHETTSVGARRRQSTRGLALKHPRHAHRYRYGAEVVYRRRLRSWARMRSRSRVSRGTWEFIYIPRGIERHGTSSECYSACIFLPPPAFWSESLPMRIKWGLTSQQYMFFN